MPGILVHSSKMGSLLNIWHNTLQLLAISTVSNDFLSLAQFSPAAFVTLARRATALKLQLAVLTPCVWFRLMKSDLINRLLPLGLCLAISFDGLSPAAFAQNIPTDIRITVVEGEGVTSGIRQPVKQDPVVRIDDDDQRPVAGAAVVFVLPVSGTSGEFANGSKTLTVVTGKDGLAAARGLRTNQVPGELQIYVTASYQGLRARTLVTQLVEAPAGTRTLELGASKSGGKWKWVLLGIAAAGGAGAGVYFGTRNSDPSPISISAGTVVFGSPR